MLNVDLSTLRGQELRQLLDTTRRRGDAAVTYEILQEMAVRRERGEPEQRRGLFGPKRPAESRVIELNLGDPLDPKDPELDEPAGPHAPAAMGAPADWELDALDAAGDEREDATYLHPPAQPEFDDQPPPPKPRRRALWLSTGLGLGLVVGLALGGWAESVSRQGGLPLTVAAATPAPATRTPLAAAAPAADPIAVETETAPATPPPAPPPPPVAVASAPIPGAIAPTPAPVTEPAAASTEVAEETPDTAKPIPASTGTKACAAQPTPADRTICETPRLQKLQKDLRLAYADALEAHQDRDLLREHELAWRDARSPVTEPAKLAQLYEERIRKLKAATAEALKAR